MHRRITDGPWKIPRGNAERPTIEGRNLTQRNRDFIRDRRPSPRPYYSFCTTLSSTLIIAQVFFFFFLRYVVNSRIICRLERDK